MKDVKEDRYAPGATCKINKLKRGDSWVDSDARKFCNPDCVCVIVKRTKSGLILVAKQDDPTQTYSFAQYNIDLI